MDGPIVYVVDNCLRRQFLNVTMFPIEEERRTVAGLLKTAGRCHAHYCGCSHVVVGTRAWFVRDQTYVHGQFDATRYEELPLDTSLRVIRPRVDPTQPLHLVMEGIIAKPSQFSVTMFNESSILRVNAGQLPADAGGGNISEANPPQWSLGRLPEAGCGDWLTLTSTADTLLVNKTKFVLPEFTHEKWAEIVVLRRSSGFGKTTFLSMLASYVDKNLDKTRHPELFPSAIAFTMVPDYFLDRVFAGGLLVVQFDFGQIDFSSCTTFDACVSACRAYWLQCAPAIASKYKVALACFPGFSPHPLDPNLPLFSATFNIFAMHAHFYDLHWFISVDNYTDPFLNSSPAMMDVIERALYEEFVQPILHLCQYGTVPRCYFMGRHLEPQQAKPWESHSQFKAYCSDLTACHNLEDIIGLNGDEIRALGLAALPGAIGKTFLERIEQLCGMPAAEDVRLYNTRDILDFVAELRAPGRSSGPRSQIIRYLELGSDHEVINSISVG